MDDTEIELKFQVAPAQRAALRRAVGTARARTCRLQAHYFDTAGGDLARAALALRLRREDGVWVQTLKAAGADGLQRLEHNVTLAAARSTPPPALELARHDGHPAGAALARALRRAGDAALVERYGTAVTRVWREVRVRGARIELAFDQGWLRAGAQREPICELELELLRGDVAALLALAARWVQRHALVLDVRTKSERGHWLALQQRGSPPRPAAVDAGAAAGAGHADAAVRAMLRAALQPALANASQIVAGPSEPEHLHQLRVALRRLQTVLQVFGASTTPQASALLPALRELQHGLGRARDLDVLAVALRQAWQRAGADAAQAQAWFETLRAHRAGAAAAGGAAAGPSADDAAGVAQLLAQGATQQLWLQLIAASHGVADAAAGPARRGAQADAGADAEAAAEAIARAGGAAPAAEAAAAAPVPAPLSQLLPPLRRLHRQVRRDAARAQVLDDAALHRLRRRIKRLRYALESVAPWWPRRSRQGLLESLRAAQEALGQWHDALIGQAAARTLAEAAGSAAVPPQWIAVGWLAAQVERQRGCCCQALARLCRPAAARRARKAWRAAERQMRPAQGH